MSRFYLALLPWAMFDVVLRSAGLSVVWGAGLALVTAVVVLVFVLPGDADALAVASFTTFSALLLMAVTAHSGIGFRPYARAIATGSLSVVCLTSVLGTPCTGRFVRQVTAPHHWSDPEFHSFNVRLSIMWGAAFTTIAAFDTVAAYFPSALVTTVFNWILPIGILIAAGLRTDLSIARSFDGDEPTIGDLVETLGRLRPERRSEERVRRRPLHLYRSGPPTR